MWPSAAVAHLVQGSTCCAFKDTLLYISIKKKRLFELLLSFYQLKSVWTFSSDLFHQQRIFAHRIVTQLNVFFPWPFSVNPSDSCIWKFKFSSFFKYLDLPIWHPQPCHIQQSHIYICTNKSILYVCINLIFSITDTSKFWQSTEYKTEVPKVCSMMPQSVAHNSQRYYEIFKDSNS